MQKAQQVRRPEGKGLRIHFGQSPLALWRAGLTRVVSELGDRRARLEAGAGPSPS